jgi:acetyl-CoA carboxylase biotin carboxyl carrier protein
MNLDQIKHLIDMLLESEITEIEIEEEGARIRVRKDPPAQQVVQVGAAPIAPIAPSASLPVAAESVPEVSPYSIVKSPMVGTFYRAPSPESANFVEVGDRVTPDTIICILEAMKIMNELKAGISGTVKAILAENGETIEFGQPLFEIDPS